MRDVTEYFKIDEREVLKPIKEADRREEHTLRAEAAHKKALAD
jgi:hypothetical protein